MGFFAMGKSSKAGSRKGQVKSALLGGEYSVTPFDDLKKHYDFDVNAMVGEGNFAKVYIGTTKPGKGGEARVYKKTEVGNSTDDMQPMLPIPDKVAIKMIDMQKVEDIDDIRREITIMKAINHQHVVNLFEVFESPKKVVLILEPAEGGELFDRIVEAGQYTEKDAASTIAMLCDALQHLHENNIVHRDIKPENILFKSNVAGHPDYDVLKLADFGLARDYSQKQQMKTACGTPGYVAPEILENKGYAGPACDLWSTGVLLYILLCGFPPFYEENLPDLFDSILKARFDFPDPWWEPVDKRAINLIKNELLVVDPARRITAKQVKEHDWIQHAADRSLMEAQKAMKKFNATRKLRKVAGAIIAQGRINKALESLRAGLAAADAPVEVS